MKDELAKAWTEVTGHAERLGDHHLRRLFVDDPARASRFTAAAAGLFLDYSKNRVDDEALSALLGLCEAACLDDARTRLFAGEPVNNTEARSALHMMLRVQSGGDFPNVERALAGQTEARAAVAAVLDRMSHFCEEVRSGRWCGYSGAPIRDVVNIGIGGSDLGPKMICRALRHVSGDGPNAHFVSNLDGTELAQTLQNLDPATTLFVIASKTFTTQETLANARSARRWLTAAGGEAAVAKHFVALSTNREKVVAFGIAEANMFPFWDWVGGRYSSWSAIGLSIALALGFEEFRALHRGAAAMDEHFVSTPWRENVPVLLALLQVWYRNGFGAQTRAVLPYDWALRDLPSYLQQLEMESLGKSVMRNGESVPTDTSPIIWGGAGNNGQHAYYQMLHQGTTLVPSDFFIPAFAADDAAADHAGVLANALGQMEALMNGRTLEQSRADLRARGEEARVEELAPHLVMRGNQPTNAIVYERLDAETLGAIIAMYEHKVFVQSVVWDINAFDQYGVELGKQRAGVIEPELAGDGPRTAHDASTDALISRLIAMRR